jgi:hypothetical protein
VATTLGIKWHGRPAWWLARGYHLAMMPGPKRKMRLLIDWNVEVLFGRDSSELAGVGRAPSLGDEASSGGSPAHGVPRSLGQLPTADGATAGDQRTAGDQPAPQPAAAQASKDPAIPSDATKAAQSAVAPPASAEAERAQAVPADATVAAQGAVAPSPTAPGAPS